MELRTTVKPLESKGLISHDRGIVMFGSCFSDNIGIKLRNAMFNVDINPFGTTFNPHSIALSIDRILAEELIDESSLFYHNGVWNHFNFHSRYSGVDKEAVLNKMNAQISSAYRHIQSAQNIIITFGTAYVYALAQEHGSVVNNCHKLPADRFTRTRLEVEDIVEKYKMIIPKLLEINPNVKIIFTVSPIRHLADGIADNSLSKCVLRLAVSQIINSFPAQCSYFPAYEIMLDDLRDYRFYASDMIHPSEIAIEYIWEVFQNSYLHNSEIALAAKCTKLYKRFTHHHMTDNIEIIKKFNNDTQRLMAELTAQYPYLNDVVDNLLQDNKNSSL